MRLQPRKTLDLTWTDLCEALKACLRWTARNKVERELAQVLAPDERLDFALFRAGRG